MRRWQPALSLVLGVGSLSGAPLRAQYPVAPSPVMDLATLSPTPRFSGYVAFRETLRHDTSTFTINRARITVQTRPMPWTAIRLQADIAAIGRAAADTIPSFLMTDAFIQLEPPDSASRLSHSLRPALVAGQFRTPFSQEYQTPFSLQLSINRARVVDRLSPRRDIGVLARVRAGPLVTAMAALVNGEGPNRATNPDGRQMAVARLTVQPRSWMAVSGKWASQRADHRWGADARFVGKHLVLEGETIARSGPVTGSATTNPLDASGAYVLAAYRIGSWLRPMVKAETMRETPTSPDPEVHARWLTCGLDFVSPRDRASLQINVITKRETPVSAPGELLVQLKALF